MLRRPPRSTRTDTVFPYTTLFRSSQISVARARYAAEPILAATGVLSRDQADPRSEVPARLEHVRIGDASNEGAREQWAYAGDIHQAASDFGLAGARADAPVVLAHLLLHDRQLRAEHLQAKPTSTREALVIPEHGNAAWRERGCQNGG